MSNIVTSIGNVAAKHSAEKGEGDDGLKTLECLRGRLLSERVTSKAANVEADYLGDKLIELENKLKEEVTGRNRAQKRLKSLLKKLESSKIVYVASDESSSHSNSFRQSELSVSSSSSSTSTTSSFLYPNRKPEDNDKQKPNSHIRRSSKCELDEPDIKNGSTVSDILNYTDNASSEIQSFSSNEKISCDKTISEKSYDKLRCTLFSDYTKSDDHRSKSSVEDRETNGESNQDWDKTSVDNSMALVPVNLPPTTKTTITTIEPLIAKNARVGDVLDTLRYVKERLRSSIERRRMIRVGP